MLELLCEHKFSKVMWGQEPEKCCDYRGWVAERRIREAVSGPSRLGVWKSWPVDFFYQRHVWMRVYCSVGPNHDRHLGFRLLGVFFIAV